MWPKETHPKNQRFTHLWVDKWWSAEQKLYLYFPNMHEEEIRAEDIQVERFGRVVARTKLLTPIWLLFSLMKDLLVCLEPLLRGLGHADPGSLVQALQVWVWQEVRKLINKQKQKQKQIWSGDRRRLPRRAKADQLYSFSPQSSSRQSGALLLEISYMTSLDDISWW